MTHRSADHSLSQLIGMAIVSAALYVWIGFLSQAFAFGSEKPARPILLVLALFSFLFVIYLLAARVASRATNQPRAVLIIIAGGVVFRMIMLCSEPIQEVDIYRYLWDGAVSNVGVSPFRYAPAEVELSRTTKNGKGDPELAKLVEICNSNAGMGEVLRRVHWRKIKSVYPPVSQSVFAATSRLIPGTTTVDGRVRIMRVVLVGFELATILIVLLLLDLVDLPRGLVVGYAWCPLLMKECANSGHLDSIVVFLTTLGIYFIIRARCSQATFGVKSLIAALLGGIILALGVGAKIFPIVLLPWLAVISWRRRWFFLAVPTVFLICSWIVMRPMLVSPSATASSHGTAGAVVVHTSGLATFAKYWEMNDFLFLIGVENLKPDRADRTPAWFAIVPNHWRARWSEWSSKKLGWEKHLVPFATTRFVTGLAFGLIACYLAVRASRSDTAQGWAEAAFLTIAWFWLLGPTQNPWYWTWVLPLLPLIRTPVWWAMSGLVFTYYLRFWFEYHFAESAVFGTGYEGATYFDFVVTWFEFGPWFLWLFVGRMMTSARRGHEFTKKTNRNPSR